MEGKGQDQIEELMGEARGALSAYFHTSEPDKHDETRAKVAASVFATGARLKQTEGAKVALGFQIASMILDKEQLKNYIRISDPASYLAKALPEKASEPE